MKTHTLARAMQELAQVLLNQENCDIKDLTSAFSKKTNDSQHIAVNISTLVALSKIDKKEWIAFVKKHGYPIEIRPRDGSRDMIGKIINYLDETPEAQKTLAAEVRAPEQHVSNTLSNALKVLLGDM